MMHLLSVTNTGHCNHVQDHRHDLPKDPDSATTVVRVMSNISKYCFKKKFQKHQNCPFVLKFAAVS